MINKNKRGSITNIFLVTLMFNFIIMLVLFFSYVYIAVLNDYTLYEVQVAGETSFSNLPNIVAAFEDAGTSYENIGLGYVDYILLMNLIIFFITTFTLAYQFKTMNYFSWSAALFNGMMLIMFLLSIIEQFTNWFYDMLIAILPNMNINLPFFSYYLDNLGVITLLQCCAILLINIIDFDLSSIMNRKIKEEQVLGDNEVL